MLLHITYIAYTVHSHVQCALLAYILFPQQIVHFISPQSCQILIEFICELFPEQHCAMDSVSIEISLTF